MNDTGRREGMGIWTFPHLNEGQKCGRLSQTVEQAQSSAIVQGGQNSRQLLQLGGAGVLVPFHLKNVFLHSLCMNACKSEGSTFCTQTRPGSLDSLSLLQQSHPRLKLICKHPLPNLFLDLWRPQSSICVLHWELELQEVHHQYAVQSYLLMQGLVTEGEHSIPTLDRGARVEHILPQHTDRRICWNQLILYVLQQAVHQAIDLWNEGRSGQLLAYFGPDTHRLEVQVGASNACSLRLTVSPTISHMAAKTKS